MNKKLPIKLELPDEFYLEETRCDYVVTARQKRIWAVELDLLLRILAVCKKHNIEVQIFAGTLLGAVCFFTETKSGNPFFNLKFQLCKIDLLSFDCRAALA